MAKTISELEKDIRFLEHSAEVQQKKHHDTCDLIQEVIDEAVKYHGFQRGTLVNVFNQMLRKIYHAKRQLDEKENKKNKE